MLEILWTPIPFITSQWYDITYSIPIVDELQTDFTIMNTYFSPGLLFMSSVLRLESYGNVLTIQSTLVGERIFATYFVHDYEKNHRLWINCIVLPLTFLTAQIYSFSLLFLNPPLIVPLGYCVTMTSWSFFVLNYLYSSNSKKLEHLKRNPIMYTLSKKFQIEENLRIMWYFRGILSAFIILCSLMTFFLLTPSDFLDVTFKGVVRSIDLAIICLCIFFPLGMFGALYYIRHPAFLRRHRWLFGEKIRKNRIVPISVDETNVYFIQLKQSWM